MIHWGVLEEDLNVLVKGWEEDRIHVPLNHEMATIIVRVANAASTIARVAMTVGVRGGQIRVRYGRGRGIRVSRLDVKVAT